MDRRIVYALRWRRREKGEGGKIHTTNLGNAGKERKGGANEGGGSLPYLIRPK